MWLTQPNPAQAIPCLAISLSKQGMTMLIPTPKSYVTMAGRAPFVKGETTDNAWLQ